jgi:hypothetical protein
MFCRCKPEQRGIAGDELRSAGKRFPHHEGIGRINYAFLQDMALADSRRIENCDQLRLAVPKLWLNQTDFEVGSVASR